MLSQEKEQLPLFARKHKTNNNDKIVRDIQTRLNELLEKREKMYYRNCMMKRAKHILNHLILIHYQS